MDPGDPFFLWTCNITEEDFLLLKREQNLLIEYNTFPYKLVELLQQCLIQSKEASPSFTAILTVPDVGGHPASLSIMECTSFRQINHLTLRFLPPAEPQFRRHIGDILHRYKDEINYLRGSGGGIGGGGSGIPFGAAANISTAFPAQQTHFVPPPTSQQPQWSSQHKSSTSSSTATTTDVDRANEVIKKLQDELKTLRSAHKMTESSLKQYEKLSKEHRSQGDSVKEELKDTQKKLLASRTEVERLRMDREAMRQELDDSRRLVEANEKVIEWLHQQINEDSLNRVIGKPTGTFNYKPTVGTAAGAGKAISTSNSNKKKGSEWIPEWMGPLKSKTATATANTSSPSSSSSIENF